MFKFLKSLFGGNNNHAEILEAINNGAQIIDVRTRQEFQRGHIEGSTNIPVSEIGSKIQEIKRWKKPVVTVCQSGNRSRMAQKMLEQKGVTAMNGGGWYGLKNLLSR